MIIAKQVHYVGRVQGVGFRYTTARLARSFDVAGSVRNLPNGEVELVVQGSDEQVDAFLAAIAERMADNIANTRVEEKPTQALTRFTILR